MDSTHGLAHEVAAEGLRVDAVSPGPIVTDSLRPGRFEVASPRAPLQRAGSAEEVAATVLLLAADAATGLTGAILAVTGGI